ncbi:DUF6879 family protein [Streptomyces sp. MK37H]|uniref:DUF6879 family protein n=1 Tax=Streptomyces sp. MK37H TaxID=2699117 RepID=UPI001B37C64B|nr:DUF6879 family protein [Streptomyces sp. MK37H]MBP8536871.1 hypothetical protein [Streptomyces sp. MK37H]
MLNINHLRIDIGKGTRLSTDAYQRDFRLNDEKIIGRNGWKLERKQHFEEPGSPSWEAFQRGNWSEALQLAQKKRELWAKVAQEDARRKSIFHRVRVVEEPLTPYMQWELHALRVQGDSGMPVRVLNAEAIKSYEGSEPLPEIVTLGGKVLYQVLYTEAGILDGAIRFTDLDLVRNWEILINEFYENSEDVVSYVDRYVAHLPAPQMKGE